MGSSQRRPESGHYVPKFSVFRRVTTGARRFSPMVTSLDATARLPRMQFRWGLPYTYPILLYTSRYTYTALHYNALHYITPPYTPHCTQSLFILWIAGLCSSVRSPLARAWWRWATGYMACAPSRPPGEVADSGLGPSPA